MMCASFKKMYIFRKFKNEFKHERFFENTIVGLKSCFFTIFLMRCMCLRVYTQILIQKTAFKLMAERKSGFLLSILRFKVCILLIRFCPLPLQNKKVISLKYSSDIGAIIFFRNLPLTNMSHCDPQIFCTSLTYFLLK